MAVLNIEITLFNATDDCGNAADQKVRITRQYDMTKPIITSC
jgi:hypothetical protein